MILPSKHLAYDRALLTVGAWILARLPEPKTVSALWDEIVHTPSIKKVALRYDAFVLTLDMLFLIGVIDLRDGLLGRVTR